MQYLTWQTKEQEPNVIDLQLLVDGLKPPVNTDEPYLTRSRGIIPVTASISYVADDQESQCGGLAPSWIGRTPGYSLDTELLKQIDSLVGRVGTI